MAEQAAAKAAKQPGVVEDFIRRSFGAVVNEGTTQAKNIAAGTLLGARDAFRRQPTSGKLMMGGAGVLGSLALATYLKNKISPPVANIKTTMNMEIPKEMSHNLNINMPTPVRSELGLATDDIVKAVRNGLETQRGKTLAMGGGAALAGYGAYNLLGGGNR